MSDLFLKAIQRTISSPEERETVPANAETEIESDPSPVKDEILDLINGLQPAFDRDVPKAAHTLNLAQLPEKLVGVASSDSPNAKSGFEQARVLRTRVLEMMRSTKFRTLMISSPVSGDGKTLVSTNLAFILSQVDKRVLLVDADLRRGGVREFLNIHPTSGLNTYLVNGDSFQEVCWQVNPKLTIVPTAALGNGAGELLNGSRMQSFLASAREHFDIVIVDSPPLFPIADAQILLRFIDAVLLVTCAGHTPFDLAKKAVDLLQGKLVGTILNSSDESHSHSHYYYQEGALASR